MTIPALIVGGGPAGSAAALTLAAAGTRPLLIERQRETGDALCGGFLSWRTRGSLDRLGIDRVALGGHAVGRVKVFAGRAHASAALPAPSIGLSRHRLDTVMLAAAVKRGAAIETGVDARALDGTTVRLADGTLLEASALFVATGKHDIRGLGRDHVDPDPTLGLRVRLAPSPGLAALVADAIELHLFDRCYVGLLLQEDGSANLCLAVRKSRLAEADGKPAALLAELGRATPLGDRLAYMTHAVPDAIAAIPYGWQASDTQPGVFRLGDQAAVIPSLAGEGVGIALASGMAAARNHAQDGPAGASTYQRDFACRVRKPVATAAWLWHRSEVSWTARLGTQVLALAPGLAPFLASRTRIGD